MRKLKSIFQVVAGWFKQGRRNQLAPRFINNKPRRSAAYEAERLDRLRNPSKYLGNDSKQLPGPPGPENRAS